MISSEKVSEIFKYCLFKKDEIIEGKPIIEPVYVYGIRRMFGLHPERLKESIKEIENFIDELPEGFKEGWTFPNLCLTKNGELWTGSHRVCEQLMVMGIAIKKIKYLFDREMWHLFRGGMPYLQVFMSSCRVTDCNNKAISKGYCDKHRKQIKRHGQLMLKKEHRTKCSIEGCNKVHCAKGLCRNHYYKEFISVV